MYAISLQLRIIFLQMRKKISQLEKENLTKKPWQMSGETSSTARPINSLLEEDLNFDHTTAVGKFDLNVSDNMDNNQTFAFYYSSTNY